MKTKKLTKGILKKTTKKISRKVMEKAVNDAKNISKFIINDDVIAKKRDNGDILLVKLDENDIYFTINGISVQVWEKLESGKSLEDIQEEMIKKYPDEVNKVKSLLKKFTSDLVKKKLLSPVK